MKRFMRSGVFKMQVIFVLKDGQEKVVEGAPGDTLLEIITAQELPVVGACGGAGVCGSCRVTIAPEWADRLPAPSDHELDMLEMFQAGEADRLACQVVLSDACDGLRVLL